MSSSDIRASRFRQIVTVIIGFVLAVIPLPEPIRPFRPDFLLLFVIYWSLSAPRMSGLTFGWFCGLLLDVHQGTVLGQHALGFLFVAFLTHWFQLRMRLFPILHQALTVLMMLAIYRFLIFWIDGITGQAPAAWTRWAPVLTGALLWPIVVTLMDTWNRRRR
jgi:rod shape-determining protein MreD